MKLISRIAKAACGWYRRHSEKSGTEAKESGAEVGTVRSQDGSQPTAGSCKTNIATRLFPANLRFADRPDTIL
jgi:hypothetical protein